MSLKRKGKGKGKGKGRRPSVDVDDDARQRPANPVARAPEAMVHRLKFAVERYFEDASVAICAKALARVVKVGTVVLPCSRNMWCVVVLPPRLSTCAVWLTRDAACWVTGSMPLFSTSNVSGSR